MTPVEVIIGNANRQALLEKERAKIAVNGIKKIISQAVHHGQDWNPEVEKVCASIIVEAENALQQLESHKLNGLLKYKWNNKKSFLYLFFQRNKKRFVQKLQKKFRKVKNG